MAGYSDHFIINHLKTRNLAYMFSFYRALCQSIVGGVGKSQKTVIKETSLYPPFKALQNV